MAERHSGFVQQVAGVGKVTVEDHRFAQSALWTPSGNVTSRSGMVPNAASASAPGTVKAASPTPNGHVFVDPFRYAMQSNRGGGVYTLTLDAIKDINILGDQAADPSNNRNDLIVAQQSDAYFGDANSDMVVRHVIGTPAGSPVDPPITGSTDYVVLARVVVRANTISILGSDITNFAIPWTTATGGIVPVRNQTERDALTGWPGARCFRIDKGWCEDYISGAWRVPNGTLVASLADVTNPVTQQFVRLSTDGRLYEWSGSAWVKLTAFARYARTAGTQAIGSGTILQFPSLVGTADSRVTPGGTNNSNFTLAPGVWTVSAGCRSNDVATMCVSVLTGTTYNEDNALKMGSVSNGVLLNADVTAVFELTTSTTICIGVFCPTPSISAVALGQATSVSFKRGV